MRACVRACMCVTERERERERERETKYRFVCEYSCFVCLHACVNEGP